MENDQHGVCPADLYMKLYDATSAQIKKLSVSLKKYVRFFRNLPEDLIPHLIDQWLASAWHKNANLGGTFGNQRWNYHAFRPIEKIGKNVFTCIDGDGKILRHIFPRDR